MDIKFLTDMIITLVGLSFFIPAYDLSKDSKIQCGFPGTPKYGSIKPEQDLYEEGDVVTYSCRVGYILIGKPIRRCTEDGTWTEDIPVCDDSMTTLGVAFSTPTVPGRPAELAIDRDKDSCASLKPRSNKEFRWWEIDLGNDYKVLSVAITTASTDKYLKFEVNVIQISSSMAAYKICATFSGKFGTQTLLFSCDEGKGIEGKKVHIEDKLPGDGIFDICEVEVQVEKDSGYECGKPERNPHSITDEPEFDEVRYRCKIGYRREGQEYRSCMSNGQWSGEPPACEAVVCDPLEPLGNGQVRPSVINGDIPLQGTVANYNCDEGYKLIGSFSRICLENGAWSGRKPHCEAVRCPVPDGREFGGFFRLVNKTTRMGSMAMLKCKKGKREGDNPFIVCTEEGDWTEPNARCLIPARASVSDEEGPRIVNKGAVIFGMVVAGIMIAIVFISMYIVMQRRRNGNKPELPSRQIEAPEAPPRPPPRSKASSILDFMSRKGGALEDKDSSWKTRSLPMNQNEKKEAWGEAVNAVRATSYDHNIPNESEPASRTASPQTEQKAVEPEATETEGSSKGRSATASPEVEKGKTDSPATPKKTPGREYAAVDYEKKRQSRLLKEQSSEDGDSDRIKTPTSIDENEDSTPPSVPPKGKGRYGKTAAEEEETKPARGARRTRAEPEPEPEPKPEPEPEPEDKSRRTRRTRAEVETPEPEPAPEPEPEDKTKRTRRTRAQVETPEPEPDTGRRTRRTRGGTED